MNAPDSFATSENRLMASLPLRLPNSPLESFFISSRAAFLEPLFFESISLAAAEKKASLLRFLSFTALSRIFF